MRILITLLLFLLYVPMSGQVNYNFKINISEKTVVIKKRKQGAVKLNIALIRADSFTNDTYFYRFFNNVPSNPFIIDSTDLERYGNTQIGLIYIIEDLNGKIIHAKINHPPSFKYVEDEIDYAKQVSYVNPKNLKIKSKQLNDTDRHIFELGRLQMGCEDVYKLAVYPMINKYHDLQKGKYFLTLFYAFSGTVNELPTINIWDRNKPKENQIFKGTIKSNKIILIVE